MIDGTAVKAIEELAVRANAPLDADGGVYVPAGFARTQEDLPTPTAFHDLTAFTGFARNVLTELEEGVFVHVVNPRRVELRGVKLTERGSRRTYAIATAPEPSFALSDPFDTWASLEDAIVAVDVLCAPDNDRDAVVEALSRVRVDEGVELGDDGVSQSVVMQKGISIVNREDLPRRVLLSPYRTFPEVEQATSDYVLRIREAGSGGLVVRLFVADSGTWLPITLERVGVWIRSALNSSIPVLP